MLFLGFPLLWMLSVSFKGPQELVELHPRLVPTAADVRELHATRSSTNGLAARGLEQLKVASSRRIS